MHKLKIKLNSLPGGTTESFGTGFLRSVNYNLHHLERKPTLTLEMNFSVTLSTGKNTSTYRNWTTPPLRLHFLATPLPITSFIRRSLFHLALWWYCYFCITNKTRIKTFTHLLYNLTSSTRETKQLLTLPRYVIRLPHPHWAAH